MARDPRAVRVLPVPHERGCRSYVVVDPATLTACVVDPLLDRLSETSRILGEQHAKVRWIIDTHSHADHLSGAAALRDRTGGEIVMHPAAPCEIVDRRPADGDLLELGEQELRVHHAPGNTPDALVIEARGAFFTGDTLLIGTVGLQDAPGADARTWFDSLHRIFGEAPGETVLHPGHDDMGRTQSTLRHERTGNGWLRLDDLEAFVDRVAADDRPFSPDAAAVLAANRQGLARVPRDLAAASGLQDPARATEEALRRQPAEASRSAPPPRASGPRENLLFFLGLVTVVSVLAGWLVHPLLHGGAALAGILLVAWGFPRRRSRRGANGAGLFYEGPARRGIGG